MICYKDRTFCEFYTTCKHGEYCTAALDIKIKEGAKAYGLPIAVYVDKPECWSKK